MTIERVGRVVNALMAEGEMLTTREVADMIGITWHGAYYMLTILSRELAIYRDDAGRWRRV